MKLLVIRHAPAGDRAEFARTGLPDEQRPLTAEGREKMRAAARGLREVVGTVDVIATSPLVRAAETAEIVSQRLGGETVVRDELAPDADPDALVPWLRLHGPGETVAVVGHEPHLGYLVGWLVTGRHDSFLQLKKGAACLLEFDEPPAAGGATLLWALAPAHLRALGRRG